MCAIFGIGIINGCTITDNNLIGKLLAGLLKSGQSRGRDASGIAIASRSKITILKRDLTADAFTSINAFNNAMCKYCDISTISDLNPISIIGHCRAKTKGPEKVYENNHPIKAGSIVGIHNGMVSNDDSLFRYWSTKHDYMKRAGTVDSEILFRLINMYHIRHKINVRTSISKTMGEINGSVACAFLNSNNPYSLYLFRNYNPTEIFLYEEKGIVIFASQQNYIKSSVAGLKLGEPTKIEYDRSSMIHIDLFKNRINTAAIHVNNEENKYLKLPMVQ